MEFFINDPNLERFAPADTRILDLHAQPAPDGKRLRVSLELTPFQKRPDLELSLNDSLGSQVSAVSIIEPVSWKLELTLHIRKVGETSGKYTLTASLSYPEMGEIDHRTLLIDIPVLTQ